LANYRQSPAIDDEQSLLFIAGSKGRKYLMFKAVDGFVAK
jgi:hypothetical protein